MFDNGGKRAPPLSGADVMPRCDGIAVVIVGDPLMPMPLLPPNGAVSPA
jgi:hypothetical protein